MKSATWTVTAMTFLMVGCSTTAPTANKVVSDQPADRTLAQRSVLADGQTSPEQLAKILPTRLTKAEGDRMLIDLPADKMKGDFSANQQSRKVQGGMDYGSYGYGGYGAGDCDPCAGGYGGYGYGGYGLGYGGYGLGYGGYGAYGWGGLYGAFGYGGYGGWPYAGLGYGAYGYPFRYFNYGSFYYPYYLSAGFYYPVYARLASLYYMPYFYGYGSYFYPYSYGFRRFWW